MFTNVANRKAQRGQKGDDETDDSVPNDTEEGQEEAKNEESKAEGETAETATATEAPTAAPVVDKEVEEKASILDGVRKYALSMQSDIKDLLKNEWAGTINNLETEKKKAENDR